MITTDHSPSTPDLKLLEEGDFLRAWGGISGIQVRLSILSLRHFRDCLVTSFLAGGCLGFGVPKGFF